MKAKIIRHRADGVSLHKGNSINILNFRNIPSVYYYIEPAAPGNPTICLVFEITYKSRKAYIEVKKIASSELNNMSTEEVATELQEWQAGFITDSMNAVACPTLAHIALYEQLEHEEAESLRERRKKYINKEYFRKEKEEKILAELAQNQALSEKERLLCELNKLRDDKLIRLADFIELIRLFKVKLNSRVRSNFEKMVPYDDRPRVGLKGILAPKTLDISQYNITRMCESVLLLVLTAEEQEDNNK